MHRQIATDGLGNLSFFFFFVEKPSLMTALFVYLLAIGIERVQGLLTVKVSSSLSEYGQELQIIKRKQLKLHLLRRYIRNNIRITFTLVSLLNPLHFMWLVIGYSFLRKQMKIQCLHFETVIYSTPHLEVIVTNEICVSLEDFSYLKTILIPETVFFSIYAIFKSKQVKILYLSGELNYN